MTGQARPWWASDGPVDGGVAPDEDPLARVRADRRRNGGRDPGDEPTFGPERHVQFWEAAAGAVSRLADDLGTIGESHAPSASDAPGAGPDRASRDDRREGADPGATTQEEHQREACGVCPICVGLRALAEARPELVGHLAEAARHVALAARSLADGPPADDRDEPLEHIDLD